MYSADLSLFVLDAGIRLVEQRRAQLLYLSLSDYVQHGHAPGEMQALEFHRALDDRLARLEELGCVVAVTADHGMNDKALPDGRPHVLFLEDILNARFGEGAVRVICPITDPFVRHHGALGSFVRVYQKPERQNAAPIASLAAAVRALPGIDAVLTRAEACARYELPYDREADRGAVAVALAEQPDGGADDEVGSRAGLLARAHPGARVEYPGLRVAVAALHVERGRRHGRRAARGREERSTVRSPSAPRSPVPCPAAPSAGEGRTRTHHSRRSPCGRLRGPATARPRAGTASSSRFAAMTRSSSRSPSRGMASGRRIGDQPARRDGPSPLAKRVVEGR